MQIVVLGWDGRGGQGCQFDNMHSEDICLTRSNFTIILMRKVDLVREVQYSSQADFAVKILKILKVLKILNKKIFGTGKVFPISFTCQPPLLTSPQLEQPQDQGGEASHPRRGCQPPPRGRLVSEV